MLKFKSLNRNEAHYGYYHIQDSHLIFFGNKFTTRQILLELFPSLKFLELNQTHSCDVVRRYGSETNTPSADGHWTQDLDTALLIRTADCIPLMVQSPNGIAALHAGWRGVAGQIVAQLLNLKEFNNSEAKFYVGPHIAWESFEVGNDVAERLLLSDPNKNPMAIRPHKDPNKKYVDLDSILKGQISSPIHFIQMDTFTSDQFCSYRREPVNTGRQFSFIARLSSLRDTF